MRLGMRRVSHAAILGFAATALLHLGLDLVWGRPPLALFEGLLALVALLLRPDHAELQRASPWSPWAASPARPRPSSGR